MPKPDIPERSMARRSAEIAGTAVVPPLALGGGGGGSSSDNLNTPPPPNNRPGSQIMGAMRNSLAQTAQAAQNYSYPGRTQRPEELDPPPQRPGETGGAQDRPKSTLDNIRVAAAGIHVRNPLPWLLMNIVR